jgi:hypothetical protein
LSRLANSLAVLQPRVRPLDRDALMFRAGQASVPRTGWKWPLAASLSSFLAVVLGATLVLRAAQGPAVVSVPKPMPPMRNWQDQPPAVPFAAPPGAPTTPSPYSSTEEPPLPRHLQIQEQILRWGLDGLPAAPAPAQPRPESIDMFLRSF